MPEESPGETERPFGCDLTDSEVRELHERGRYRDD